MELSAGFYFSSWEYLPQNLFYPSIIQKKLIYRLLIDFFLMKGKSDEEICKEYIKVISSCLRIPLLHFYPHKNILISYLWGSMRKYTRTFISKNSCEIRLYQVGTNDIKGWK